MIYCEQPLQVNNANNGIRGEVENPSIIQQRLKKISSLYFIFSVGNPLSVGNHLGIPWYSKLENIITSQTIVEIRIIDIFISRI